MLHLHVQQHEWILAQERERLASALDTALPTLWPSLAQQLGPRSTAFVKAALQAAQHYGMELQPHAVRLFTLWCVWGPSFESQADGDWAREVLSAPQRGAAVQIQQLVLQTRARLQQLGTLVKPEALDHALTHVDALLAKPQVRSWIVQMPQRAQAQALCDFQSIDIISLDQPWRKEYVVELTAAGDLLALHKTAIVPRQHYRIDRASVNQEVMQLAILAEPMAQGVKATLHVRGDMEHVCHKQLHPRITWSHARGVDVGEGHAQQRQPLYCLESAWGAQGMPARLFGEPQPGSLDVVAQACGMRLAGAPIREHKIHVSVWPSSQWLAEVRNSPQPEICWPPAGAQPPVRSPDVLLLKDAQVVSSAHWQQAWQQLHCQLQEAVSRWVRNLEREAVLQDLQLSLLPNLMHGRSMLTWGMREDVSDSTSAAFLRMQGEGDWVACGTELNLQAFLSQGGAQARITLRSVGHTKMNTRIAREANTSTAAEALAQVRVRWKHAFEIEVEPVTTPDLSMLVLEPTASVGALCGEAGIRPRSDGCGHEWYCQMYLEPMQLHYTVWDPLTGGQRFRRELWPNTPLLDWSAG